MVEDSGHSAMMMEQSFQLLRSNYLIKGKDFPFVFIPQLYVYSLVLGIMYDTMVHYSILHILC